MILAKAGDDVFNVDICHPLSPRIGMAIASSSFDFKWVSQWFILCYLILLI